MKQGIPYTIIHSRRKTMAVQVKKDGQVVVRCPLWVSDKRAGQFLEEHGAWVAKQYERVQERIRNQVSYDPEQVKAYREEARKILTEKTALWAQRMGVTYGRITIREQTTRWGSCSGKGNLNYNWKLVLLPEELLEYAVVHELAHRKEMNHSERFWNIVEQELPDYRQRRKALRSYEDKINP